MEDNEQENSTNNFDIRDLMLTLIAMMVTAFIFLAPVVAFAYLLAQGLLLFITLL